MITPGITGLFSGQGNQFLKLMLTAASILLVSGCTTTTSAPAPEDNGPGQRVGTPAPTVVSYSDYNDPLIGINRVVFRFNDYAYRYALIPLSRGYRTAVPEPVRDSVTRVFSNLKSPISAFNFLLQGRPDNALDTITRFGLNSTLGLLGLFDPADTVFGITPVETGFNDTLAKWGSGYTFYLVLPLAGPADLRNGLGRLGDYLVNPVVYLTDGSERVLIMGFDAFNEFGPQADSYLELAEEADDLYIFVRNMYLQGLLRDEEFQRDQ